MASNYILGTYALKKDTPVRIGYSVGTYPAGHRVELKQIDREYRKVLLQFGERDIDWFHESFVEHNLYLVTAVK